MYLRNKILVRKEWITGNYFLSPQWPRLSFRVGCPYKVYTKGKNGRLRFVGFKCRVIEKTPLVMLNESDAWYFSHFNCSRSVFLLRMIELFPDLCQVRGYKTEFQILTVEIIYPNKNRTSL